MRVNRASTPVWQEERRFRALELKRHGWTHEEVAEALGVTKAAVSKWMKAVRAHGETGLQARPRKGATPKLSQADLDSLPELLARGAPEYGFRGEVWTCARVAGLIEWGFGVSYHPHPLARLLKALDLTPQKPLKRDSRRNEAEIAHWRAEVWPRLKKGRGASSGSLSVLTNLHSICWPGW